MPSNISPPTTCPPMAIPANPSAMPARKSTATRIARSIPYAPARNIGPAIRKRISTPSASSTACKVSSVSVAAGISFRGETTGVIREVKPALLHAFSAFAGLGQQSLPGPMRLRRDSSKIPRYCWPTAPTIPAQGNGLGFGNPMNPHNPTDRSIAGLAEDTAPSALGICHAQGPRVSLTVKPTAPSPVQNWTSV